jgi:hypothetical protein
VLGVVAGVPGWHARGQGFKSPQLHNLTSSLLSRQNAVPTYSRRWAARVAQAAVPGNFPEAHIEWLAFSLNVVVLVVVRIYRFDLFITMRGTFWGGLVGGLTGALALNLAGDQRRRLRRALQVVDHRQRRAAKASAELGYFHTAVIAILGV